jgi:hypothetical protein
MKGTYQEKLGVISQTLWIQNVVNFNHALVLPPLSHRLKKKKKKKCRRRKKQRERVRKNFISLKLLLWCYNEVNNGKIHLNHLMIHYWQLQIFI